MTDLTTLSDEALEFLADEREITYREHSYKLSASSLSNAERFSTLLEPGGVRLNFNDAYNQDLTERTVAVRAYAGEPRSESEEAYWHLFYDEESFSSEAVARQAAHSAVQAFRDEVEVIRELQRRAEIRRQEKLAVIKEPVETPEEFI